MAKVGDQGEAFRSMVFHCALLCCFLEHSHLTNLQDFEHDYKSIPDYMLWIASDSSRHHPFVEKSQSFLQKCWDNPSRFKVRDSEKTASTTTADHRVGRSLVGCWYQAVPMEKYGQHYSGTPEKTGHEVLQGRRQAVAYVPKKLDGWAKPDHYDVMEIDDNTVTDSRTLARQHSDADTDDEEAYNARAKNAKSLVWERQQQAAQLVLSLDNIVVLSLLITFLCCLCSSLS